LYFWRDERHIQLLLSENFKTEQFVIQMIWVNSFSCIKELLFKYIIKNVYSFLSATEYLMSRTKIQPGTRVGVIVVVVV